MKYQIVLKLQLAQGFGLIIQPDFAVFSCLSVVLMRVQPCLKGY